MIEDHSGGFEIGRCLNSWRKPGHSYREIQFANLSLKGVQVLWARLIFYTFKLTLNRQIVSQLQKGGSSAWKKYGLWKCLIRAYLWVKHLKLLNRRADFSKFQSLNIRRKSKFHFMIKKRESKFVYHLPYFQQPKHRF